MPRSQRLLPAVLLLALAALSLARCQKELPAAPDALVEGITVYEHANYTAASALLTGDASDLTTFKGICRQETTDLLDRTSSTWNNCISSIGVRRR